MMLLIQSALALALISAVLYGFWEVRRWKTLEPQEALSLRQRRLRLYGLFFLLLVLVLCLGGTFLPSPRTKIALVHALGYWLITALAALPLVPLALLDARENLKKAMEERRRLREETVLSKAAPSPPQHNE
jgi:Na+/H+ antiporter NhaD/arsenite permease-like protein